MPIFAVSIPESEENTTYDVRAHDCHTAANFYVEAIFKGRVVGADGMELEQAGAIKIEAQIVDNGEDGLLEYTQPDVMTVMLEELPAWQAALAQGYEPGSDIDDFVETQKQAENAFEFEP